MRILIVLSALLFAMPVSQTLAAPPTEEQTLLVLADQVHLAMHDEHVTRPDLTTERLARSSQQLPPGWPLGTPKGLLAKNHIEDVFLALGLDDLDEGAWVEFRIQSLYPSTVHVFVKFKRDSKGEINLEGLQVTSAAEDFTSLTVFPAQGCGENAIECDCTSFQNGECQQANCGSNGTWQNTGQDDAQGRDVMENHQTQETRSVCSETVKQVKLV